MLFISPYEWYVRVRRVFAHSADPFTVRNLPERINMANLETTLRLIGIEYPNVGRRWDYLESLYRYAGRVPENGVILEIGCCQGDSTLAMLCGSHPSVQLLTVDPIFKTGHIQYPDCNNPDGIRLNSDFDVLQERFRQAEQDCGESLLDRLFVLPHTSAEVLKEWGKGVFLGDPKAKWGAALDLLLVDGEHTASALAIDCQWMEYLKVGGLAAYDDWMAEIEGAVREYINAHPKYKILHESTHAPHEDMVVTLIQRIA